MVATQSGEQHHEDHEVIGVHRGEQEEAEDATQSGEHRHEDHEVRRGKQEEDATQSCEARGAPMQGSSKQTHRWRGHHAGHRAQPKTPTPRKAEAAEPKWFENTN